MEKNPEKSGFLEKFAHILKLLGFISSLTFVLFLALAIGLYGLHRHNIPDVAFVKDYRPSMKSKVFAQNGELIAEFGNTERIVVPKDEIPPLLIKAFIAAEDKNFFHHNGIDAFSIIKALMQSIVGDRTTLRGASTITQQLAKSIMIKRDGFLIGTKRSIARKVKEAILARRLERHLDKDEILWIYLNDVYLGDGAYGVARAAKNYFDKNLSNLTLGEMALLAGLLQAPSRYSPHTNLSLALARQAYVLQRMEEDGYINHQEHLSAIEASKNIIIHKPSNIFRTIAPYYSETVRKLLVEEFGESLVYESGLNIYTTLNIDHALAMQTALKQGLIDIDKRQGFLGPIFRPTDETLREHSRKLVAEINQKDLLGLGASYSLAVVDLIDSNKQTILLDLGNAKGSIHLPDMSWARPRNEHVSFESAQLNKISGAFKVHDVILVKRISPTKTSYTLEQEPAVEGAMVSMEPYTGYITSLEGGYSFDRSEFNRIYQACRQPGSLFKPVVYAAAIASGNYTPATLVMDEPLLFTKENGEKLWEPQNFDHTYKGSVTVREALMMSINIPTINVMADVGIRKVLKFAKDLGISTKLKNELGTAIGSSCVTPIEMMRAFSVFANLGVRAEPMLIREITDRDHKRLRFAAHQSDPWVKRSDQINKTIDDFFIPEDRVMSTADAYTMHYLLEEAVRYGTAQRASTLGRIIAGKTGTTNDSFDTWFLGYAKSLMSLVWVGNDTMEIPLGVYEQGGKTAVPLFNNFMKPALEGVSSQGWVKPSSLCSKYVDARTGYEAYYGHENSFLAPMPCGEN